MCGCGRAVTQTVARHTREDKTLRSRHAETATRTLQRSMIGVAMQMDASRVRCAAAITCIRIFLMHVAVALQCNAMQPHRDACTALHCTATYAIRTSEKQEMEYGERITIALVDASPCRLTAGDMRDRFGCGLYTHGDDIGYRSKARSVAERRRSADRTHRAVGGSTHSREQLLKEPPIARNEVASSTRKAAITQACGSHTVAAYTRGTGTGEIERNQAHRINAR